MISIITVHLNDWARLMLTAKSVATQHGAPSEWLIKDGGSRLPTAVETGALPTHKWIALPDGGLYDAMNQAIPSAHGDLVHFLNCGDTYWANNTLELVRNAWENAGCPDIIYGNIFDENEGATVVYPAKLSEFYVFRRTVCQQAIFYRRSFLERIGGFSKTYQVCADNELLVRAVLSRTARIAKFDVTLIRYGAAGISASREGMRRGALEVREIRRRYFPIHKRLLYSLAIALTMPRLRTALLARCWGGRVALVYRKIANLLNA